MFPSVALYSTPPSMPDVLHFRALGSHLSGSRQDLDPLLETPERIVVDCGLRGRYTKSIGRADFASFAARQCLAVVWRAPYIRRKAGLRPMLS